MSQKPVIEKLDIFLQAPLFSPCDDSLECKDIAAVYTFSTDMATNFMIEPGHIMLGRMYP